MTIHVPHKQWSNVLDQATLDKEIIAPPPQPTPETKHTPQIIN
jgi:hypothetical protein